MQRPRLKANLVAEIIDGDRIFLVADDQHHMVRGAAPVAVLPYLDGTLTIADIAEQLAGRVSPMQVFAAIRRFDAAGHLADGRSDMPEREIAFWDAQGIDPAVVASRLAGATVTVVVAAGIDRDQIEAPLRASGIRIADSDSDLTVVAVDDYIDPMLAQVNHDHLRSGRPWLLIKPGGLAPWLGPAFYPGAPDDPAATGCWQCLAQRLGENRQVERYLSAKHGDGVPRHTSRAGLATGPHIVANLLATEVVRALTTGESVLAARMIVLDMRDLQTTEHTLVRRPQCSACGSPTLTSQRDTKIVLTAGHAEHTTDGGYRMQSPQATFDRLKRHISPYLGAITRLGAHEENSSGATFSFTAGHNFAMVNDNMDLLRRNMRGQSGGKGRSEIQAKVSALCEAIERYSAVWRGGESVRRAAYGHLDPGVAVHMDDLLHFSPAQFAGRAAWNTDPRHRMQLVPDPFRTDVEMDWSSVWSLTNDTERLVPAGYAWYGHPDLTEHFYCVGDSNGGASGNTIEEAIVQGFCELVERDAVALWWYNRLRVPALDLDSLGDPYIDLMRAYYATMDRDMWALDLTSDLGIPTFAALSHRNHDVEDIMVGFGAHPDPRIAALRAVTELNQFLPFINQRNADGTTAYRTDDHETLAWCRGARLAAEQWLVPDPAQVPSAITDYAAPASHDLADQVRHCVARAKAVGLEVLVLDQSQPDLDLKVVKVIAPGMRHFWRRLGAGRLYDVPVRLGRRDVTTAESDMNPWNVFF